ncbi:MAG: metal ABC transporter permease [Pseudomonadota bacterium]|nr:metal ABC transporter permease [Pseudomonadota bacterium]
MTIGAIIGPYADYSFMRRALVGCMLASFGSTPLGVLLVLRRMSLMGDAMAHAILPGIALGFMCAGLSVPAMSLGGLMAGFVVVVAVGLATRFTSLREDASLAAFYLIALALGVILVSTHGTALDLVHLLFGSVLAIDKISLLMIAAVTAVTLFVLAIIYRPLVVESFDPVFMRAVRGRGGVYHMVFLVLVLLNLVAGFQALGTLMAVGLMILPAVAARFWARGLFPIMGIAVVLGVLASFFGLTLSYGYNVPTGPAIILVAGMLYLVSLVFGRYDSLRARYFPFRHLEI